MPQATAGSDHDPNMPKKPAEQDVLLLVVVVLLVVVNVDAMKNTPYLLFFR